MSQHRIENKFRCRDGRGASAKSVQRTCCQARKGVGGHRCSFPCAKAVRSCRNRFGARGVWSESPLQGLGGARAEIGLARMAYNGRSRRAPYPGHPRRRGVPALWRAGGHGFFTAPFLLLAPLSEMRWALWTSRSRMESARVGSPICSCHRSTGTWLVTMVERRP